MPDAVRHSMGLMANLMAESGNVGIVPALRMAGVALLWVAFFLNYADRQVAFSILPALQRDLHFTSVQLGFVGTVFIWVYSLAMRMRPVAILVGAEVELVVSRHM